MNYLIWDKKTPINGVGAEAIKDSFNVRPQDEIFLIMKGSRVTELQFKDVIISNLNLSPEMTIDQVAQEYVKVKLKEEVRTQQDGTLLGKQQEEIEELKKQNAELSYLIMQQGGAL